MHCPSHPSRKLQERATFTLSAIRDLEECINLSPEVIQNTGGNVTRLRNALSEAGAAIREELDSPLEATRRQLRNSAVYFRAYRAESRVAELQVSYTRLVF